MKGEQPFIFFLQKGRPERSRAQGRRAERASAFQAGGAPSGFLPACLPPRRVDLTRREYCGRSPSVRLRKNVRRPSVPLPRAPLPRFPRRRAPSCCCKSGSPAPVRARKRRTETRAPQKGERAFPAGVSSFFLAGKSRKTAANREKIINRFIAYGRMNGKRM